MSLVGFAAKNHPQQVGKNGANGDVDDRQTPPEIFDPLHAKHGFTLDAAASAENAKVSAYFDVASDGLAQPWSGVVWCNPPYSNIGAWVEKAWRAVLHEGARCVVMLLPSNRTEQKWWQEHVEPFRDGKRRERASLSVQFLPGRPRFFRPSGQVGGPKGDRPPFGCCVLVFIGVGF